MALRSEEFHEMTATPASPARRRKSDSDVRHAKPVDHHYLFVWLLEPPTAAGVLTQDGMTQIAYHKYRAGTNTNLDTLLNPYWSRLTECLPMNMAPNLVTTLGGLHCLLSFILTWKYDTTPWLLLLNGYCTAIYYTLDCMDGKQARRTSSSSPLGQLFDHGMDCLCLLAHLASVQAWLRAPVVYYFGMQATLQFSFFVAQWEEYYTGVLPHATGQVGVTEVNYGLAVLSVVNAFVDGKTLYRTPVFSVLPEQWTTPTRFTDVFVTPLLGGLPLADLQIRHVCAIGWYCMVTTLILLSWRRVYLHVGTWKRRGAAFVKLATPAVLAASVFLLPRRVLYREQQWVSLAVGLALVFVTIKVIVFSMAKQAYAVVQWDAAPWLLAVVWMRNDPRITSKGVHLLLQVLSVWYLYRLWQWTSLAIAQLCARLNIKLFDISKSRGEC